MPPIEAARPPALRAQDVRGVVFDLDGTLVDSYRPIAASLNHARATSGLAPLPVDTVRHQVGRGLETLIRDMVGPDRVDRGVALFRERYSEIFLDQTTLLPRVNETLEALHRAGLPLSVASNKPARFGERILDHLGVGAFFRTVQGPDRAGTTKPEPTMIRTCVREMGLELPAAVYVGDMPLDVESAARAGLPVILVTTGSAGAECLAATGELVLSRLDELLPALHIHRSSNS